MMTLDYTKWVERIKERSAPLRPLPTGEQPVLKYLEGVKAVLFDVYGTLIISGSGDIDEIKDDGKKRIDIQSLLNDYGIDMDPSTLHTAFKHEVRKVHEIKKAKGILFPEVRYEEIWSQVIDSLSGDRLLRFGLEYEMISNPVYPMPHMAETLSFCKELNLHLGLISNAQFFTPLFLEAFLGKSLSLSGFDDTLLLFSFQLGIAKPAVELFKEARARASQLGVSAKEVLFIGNNMLKDVYPAQAAGFLTGLFAGDVRSLRWRENDDRCNGISPDIVITELNQLTTCIKE